MNVSPSNACPLAEGIDFNTLDQLKHACRTWAVKQTFEFKTVRASKTRYEIVCKGDNCPWHLSARSVGGPGGFFRIKSFMSDHFCVGINHSGHQQRSLSAISSSLGFNNSLNTVLETLSKISNLNLALTFRTTKPSEQNNLPSV